MLRERRPSGGTFFHRDISEDVLGRFRNVPVELSREFPIVPPMSRSNVAPCPANQELKSVNTA
jgi:hypothetical protein